jgi:hypothetical protein
MVCIGGLSEYAKSGLPTAVKGIRAYPSESSTQEQYVDHSANGDVMSPRLEGSRFDRF